MAVISTAAMILSALASIGGAAMSAIQNKKSENRLLGQKSDLDSMYYQGALENAGARAYLKRIGEMNEDALKGINNSAVSTGSTVENTLAAKQAANESTSNAIDNLLAREENRKLGYFNARNNLNNKLGEIDSAKAQNWVTLAGNISQAAGNLGEAYLNDSASGAPYFSANVADSKPVSQLANADTANQNNILSNNQKSLDDNIKNDITNSGISPIKANEELLEEMRKRQIAGSNGAQIN